MTLLNTSFYIERLTLPHEDAAAHRRLYEEWMAAYPCRGPIERGYIHQAVVALLEMDRIERVLTTLRTERVRMAVALKAEGKFLEGVPTGVTEKAEPPRPRLLKVETRHVFDERHAVPRFR